MAATKAKRIIPKGYKYQEEDASKRKGWTLVRKSNINRNQACPCGSGKKFKHCHMAD
jgi:uncharacterized protein YecA (UPF0149 family)